MPAPSTPPQRWAYGPGEIRVAPLSGLAQVGWSPGDVPTAENLNFNLYTYGEWTTWLATAGSTTGIDDWNVQRLDFYTSSTLRASMVPSGSDLVISTPAGLIRVDDTLDVTGDLTVDGTAEVTGGVGSDGFVYLNNVTKNIVFSGIFGGWSFVSNGAIASTPLHVEQKGALVATSSADTAIASCRVPLPRRRIVVDSIDVQLYTSDVASVVSVSLVSMAYDGTSTTLGTVSSDQTGWESKTITPSAPTNASANLFLLYGLVFDDVAHILGIGNARVNYTEQGLTGDPI